MSSEDVIELGSSDEESEPAPKKSKLMPNAMLCIPRNLHEVTIKPTKQNLNIPKGLGKAITITKVTSRMPTSSKNKVNIRPTQPQFKPKIGVNPFSDRHQPLLTQNRPAHIKIAPLKPGHQKTIIMRTAPFLKNPIKIQNPKSSSILPASITVKKTVSAEILKVKPTALLNVKTKQQLNQRKNDDNVLTVELDDDEPVSYTPSPQWYLRPEDQIEKEETLEEENNKEPDTCKLIEITIEDSPVKPLLNKKTHELGADLAITIEDSPVKTVASKLENGSDDECDSKNNKSPNSRKKLEYPKDADNKKILEIDIDPKDDSSSKCNQVKNNELSSKDAGDEKNKSNSGSKIQGEDKNKESTSHSTSSSSKIEIENHSQSEYHHVYQSFIDLCLQLENSDDMRKIVDKKIKGYYKQVPKEYTESEMFIDMVTSKILSIKASPEKMYLYIKDIVDELNMQRKIAKAQPVIKEDKDEEVAETCGETSEYDTKRQRQIHKLEKTIKKLHRAIQKLDEQEVDFDDEDDSVYLLTERYKERMVRVYAKFCQLSNTKMPSEPRIQLDPRPGQPVGPSKRLEKWINKKVPIGTPLPFPDFHDVLRCVREANEEDKLNLNEADIMEEARDLFIRCGRKLQRRRQENEWRLAASRIALDIDPAETNDELKTKLIENRKIASQKENEIFNRFADRQNQLKLEAEEIGDKEAEESPIESEDEDANDDNASLECTDKRKERLKRLLQEKSKKTNEENNTSKEQKCDDEKVDPPSNAAETTVGLEIEGKTDEDKPAAEDNKDGASENINKNAETLVLSDDSNELESDIDELHLLQKLHSGNEEQSSSNGSIYSESPTAISDSLESGDENKPEIDDDIISIENSSYSENEVEKIDDAFSKKNNTIEEEIGNTVAPIQTNNGEYDDVENILLASSEEDTQESHDDGTDSVCVNLRDDLISIDETLIGNINETNQHIERRQSSLENEDDSFEMIIDNNATSNKSDDTVQKPNELQSESNTTQNGVNVLDRKVIDPVETMDIDQDEIEPNKHG